MITIEVTNNITSRDLTNEELNTVRFPAFKHINQDGHYCYIEFGDETSTDSSISTAYEDVQTQLNDLNINSNATFMLHNFNETPDSQFIRLHNHIQAALNRENQ
jgi:hypothetical protein